jgi:phosphoglycolate phosphatase
MTFVPPAEAVDGRVPGGLPPRLAIFDFDGTLADTFPWFVSVVNDVADKYGFRRIEPHEEEELRGMGAREIVGRLGVPLWKLPLIARHMRRLAAADAGAARLFAGTPGMIEALSDAGVKIAVVSSNSEANVRRSLGASAAARVDRFACGASLFGKAAKYRRVVKDLGVPAERAICIGDEIRDHEAAAAAGLAFGAVAWGYTTREALVRGAPSAVFDTMDEIVALLAPPSNDRGGSDPL